MKISAVIPVLDEAERMEDCLVSLKRLDGDWETIVVDGGSADRTVEAARRAGADRVLAAVRGRGTQLRAGAEAACGEALLFLHADTRLPGDAARRIEETLAGDRWAGGAFHVRHRSSPGAGPLTRFFLRVADFRSRHRRLPYGDQAVFTRRADYRKAGGFPPQPLMEDVEFARRLRGLGPIRRLPAAVSVSGRRFEAAPLRAFLCWNLFPALYALGVQPERLARWYGPPRRAAATPDDQRTQMGEDQATSPSLRTRRT